MDPISKDQQPGHPRRRLFRNRRIPVAMMVPNFFTLLSLAAGLTAIRMAIEGKFDFAVLLIGAAALIDGIDGRLARALKVQSRFGAELDSLADTVNFGVAPALILFIWGLGGLKGFGWVAVMVFACCMGLRLARFNAAIDTEKPKWMGNYFTGIPAPAGALTVMLPYYLDGAGIVDAKAYPLAIALYTLFIAFMLVSTIPTWSGKLIGERISRDLVPLIFGAVALVLGMLWSFPFLTLSILVPIYLAVIPLSYKRFHEKLAADEAEYAARAQAEQADPTSVARPPLAPSVPPAAVPPSETKH
ncbi:MAG: hypothetical protein RL291_411 [Pseudomonadota bacterium]